MITHIVFFKLSDKNEIEKAASLLRGLDQKVPVIRSLNVGVDVARRERSYDIALVARFDSMEDLEAYRVHPEHRKVADYLKEVSSSIASVDYES